MKILMQFFFSKNQDGRFVNINFRKISAHETSIRLRRKKSFKVCKKKIKI